MKWTRFYANPGLKRATLISSILAYKAYFVIHDKEKIKTAKDATFNRYIVATFLPDCFFLSSSQLRLVESANNCEIL